MASNSKTSLNHKDLIRQKIWPRLRQVAIPDSRFHFDFSSFIADFRGSLLAIEHLIVHPSFTHANIIFVAPDNCLRQLRHAALCAGKLVLVSTYAIRRGFILLDPTIIKSDQQRLLVSHLDGMEDPTSGAQAITLTQMLHRNLNVDLMVTGTGAINLSGIRFGKGHGFFDLEWGMLSRLNLVRLNTECVAVVHDCQILDEELHPEVFDTICDLIVTPTGIIDLNNDRRVPKPSCGILWDNLQPGMLDDIPPLMELRGMEESLTLEAC